MNHYKWFRAHVQRVIQDAYWKHASSIFTFANDNPDPDSPNKNEKIKRFWSFVKFMKNYIFGISLGDNGILKLMRGIRQMSVIDSFSQLSLGKLTLIFHQKGKALSPLWRTLKLTRMGS